MGRPMPQVQPAAHEREDADLVQQIDRAVARVAPAAAPVAGEDTDAVADRVLAALDGAATEQATGVAAASAEWVEHPVLPIAFLDGLEVTQEVQDLAHSVPLVARKPTIVRAYLRYGRGAVRIRGELRVARTPQGPWRTVMSLGSAELDPSRSGSSPGQLRSRRARLTRSLNFRLPADLTEAGTVWLRLGRIRRATGGVLPSLAHLPVHTATFHPAVPLRLRLVRLRYTMGSPSVTHEPSATDVAFIASWLRRAYPISDLQLTTTTVAAAPSPPFAAAQINAQLIALRIVDVATGTDARTHYYGMVADSGFFMRGRASGIPQTPQPATVASGPTGPASFGWDFDGSYGDWYGGHELGHTLGRFHAAFCGAAGGAPYPFPNGQLSDDDEAFVGLDVGDPTLGLPMRIVGGTDAHDLMTYCDDQWLSSFTYRGVYERLVAEDSLPAGDGRAPTDEATLDGREEPSRMRMIAALNLTRRAGAITSVLPAGGDEQVPGLAGTAEDLPAQVTVRVRDADGTVLDERPATFLRTACEDPDEDVTGVVDVTLPAFQDAASIDLLVDGAVIDSQPVGGEPAPVGELVHATQDTAAPGAQPGEALEVRWEAPEAPAGQRYIVQVSEDGGQTWQTVAVGVAEPAVTLPVDEVGGNEVQVRVLSTTGSATTVQRTDTVTVRRRGPV